MCGTLPDIVRIEAGRVLHKLHSSPAKTQDFYMHLEVLVAEGVLLFPWTVTCSLEVAKLVAASKFLLQRYRS